MLSAPASRCRSVTTTVSRGRAPTRLLILMPAWHDGPGFFGVKIVSVFPENGRRASRA